MLQRLKFDIKNLVNEMLDQLPEQVFQSDSTTFYDPSAGGGQFVIEVENRLRKYGHSDENISKRVYGSVENRLRLNYIINVNKLVGTYKTKLIEDMKFDVIVANPPYNEGKAGANKSIYDKFVSLCISLSREYTLLVTPGSFLVGNKGPYKKLRYLVKNSGLKNITTLNKSYFKGLSIPNPIYYIFDSKYKGDFTWDGINIKNDFKDSIILKPTLENKLVTKFLDNGMKDIAIRGSKTLFDSDSPRNKDKFSRIQNEEFSKKFIANNKQKELNIIYIKPQIFKPQSQGSLVVFNQRCNNSLKNLRILENGSEYDMNTNILGFSVKNLEEAHNITSYGNSKFFRFLLKNHAIADGTTLIIGKLRNLPTVPLNKSWTDPEIYSYFNLTQEEINLIESTID